MDVVEVDLETGVEVVRELSSKEEASLQEAQEIYRVENAVETPTIEERLAALEAKVT